MKSLLLSPIYDIDNKNKKNNEDRWVNNLAIEQCLNDWFWYICPLYIKNIIGSIFSGLSAREIRTNRDFVT